MLTKIPFYRDVIISSFRCEHCHVTNNSVQSANKIQEKGVNIKLSVEKASDFSREVVKSDHAVLKIPSIDFEIPATAQQSVLTTIEGIFNRVIENLQGEVEAKKDTEAELAQKLRDFVQKLTDMKELKCGPFEIVLDDPSGDSFIENPIAPNKDAQLTMSHYKRSKEQCEMLGLEDDTDAADRLIQNEEVDLKNEVVQFHNVCPNCSATCETNIKVTDIPHFKTVIIMCTICESCGVRSSEVKSGTGIEPKGVRFTLKVTDASDMNRDLLKSDSASFEIPEIEFFMNSGTLGGKFTTIEGLHNNCREQLDQVSPFCAGGDSDTKDKSDKMKECLDKIELIKTGQMLDVTIILDDPSGNSYLQVRAI